jgi:hypothetical protein
VIHWCSSPLPPRRTRCTPAERQYTIWQYDPFEPASGVPAGGVDNCCYDPTSDPPCFVAKPILSNTLGSHMVLQSAPRTAQIFGWGSPHDVITVQLLDEDGAVQQQHTVVVTNATSWVVVLTPVEAGSTPYNISVRSQELNDGVMLHNVVFGELWMCGGQSNMELTVAQAFNHTQEIAAAANWPDLRLFTVGCVSFFLF